MAIKNWIEIPMFRSSNKVNHNHLWRFTNDHCVQKQINFYIRAFIYSMLTFRKDAIALTALCFFFNLLPKLPFRPVDLSQHERFLKPEDHSSVIHATVHREFTSFVLFDWFDLGLVNISINSIVDAMAPETVSSVVTFNSMQIHLHNNLNISSLANSFNI